MSVEHTEDIEKIATFDLEKISESETVSVNLRDLMYVHQSLKELIRFFHQPKHYETLEDVKYFLGGKGDHKGYDLMHTSYYNKVRPMIESAVESLREQDAFNSMLDTENAIIPYYYKPSDET